MYIKKKIFNNNFNIIDILFLIIPYSIIFGNYLINLNLVLIIIFGSFNYKYQLKKNFIKYYQYYLTILLLLLINFYLSDDQKLTLFGLIGLLKHFLFALFLLIWFKSNDSNLKYFLISSTFGILIVSFSVLIQFTVLEIFNPLHNYDRVNGLFFDESVAGSYIVKLIIPLFIYLLVILRNIKFSIIIFVLTFSAVIISGDRAPAVLYFLSIFIFIILNNQISLYNSSKLIVILSSIILICYSISENFRSKITYTSSQLGFTLIEKIAYNVQKNIFNDREISYEEYINGENRKQENNFFETQWFKHYTKAFVIGGNNVIFGSGIKSFRSSCKLSKYNIKLYDQYSNYGCSTHPHNIYLEIFSEAGILGTILFLFVIIYLIKNSLKNKNNNIRSLILPYIFILFFPLQTTGSFFSTFNGIFYFICLSVIFYLNKFYK